MKSINEIVPFTAEYSDGVVSAILTIQKSEFEVPIILGTQSDDLKDIPGFYQRDDGRCA